MGPPVPGPAEPPPRPGPLGAAPPRPAAARNALRHRRGARELGCSPVSAPRAGGMAVRAAGPLGAGRRSGGRGHDGGIRAAEAGRPGGRAGPAEARLRALVGLHGGWRRVTWAVPRDRAGPVSRQRMRKAVNRQATGPLADVQLGPTDDRGRGVAPGTGRRPREHWPDATWTSVSRTIRSWWRIPTRRLGRVRGAGSLAEMHGIPFDLDPLETAARAGGCPDLLIHVRARAGPRGVHLR